MSTIVWEYKYDDDQTILLIYEKYKYDDDIDVSSIVWEYMTNMIMMMILI